MTSRMPVCRVIPIRVGEMQVDDVGHVRPDAIQVGGGQRVYISLLGELVECGPGTVGVERRDDGFYIDLAELDPGYRFERKVQPPIMRVRGIENVGC